MNEENDFALVPRPPSALERVESGAKRILSGMIADVVRLARKKAEDRDFERKQRGIAAANELANLVRKAAEKGVDEDEFSDRHVVALLLGASLNQKFVSAADKLVMEGYRHYWGRGGRAVNYGEAAKCYRMAAEQGYALV